MSENSDWHLRRNDLPPSGIPEFSEIEENVVFRAIRWRRRVLSWVRIDINPAFRILVLIALCFSMNIFGLAFFWVFDQIARENRRPWRRLERLTLLPVVYWRDLEFAGLPPLDIARGLWAARSSRLAIKIQSYLALAGTIGFASAQAWVLEVAFARFGMRWLFGAHTSLLLCSSAWLMRLHFAPYHVLPSLAQETDGIRASVDRERIYVIMGNAGQGCAHLYALGAAFAIGVGIVMVFGMTEIVELLKNPHATIIVPLITLFIGGAIGYEMGWWAKRSAKDYVDAIAGDFRGILRASTREKSELNAAQHAYSIPSDKH